MLQKKMVFLFCFTIYKACIKLSYMVNFYMIQSFDTQFTTLFTFKFNAHSTLINRFTLLTEIQNFVVEIKLFSIYTSHRTQHQTFSAEQRTEWTESRTAQQCSPIWTCAGFKLYNVLYVFGYYYGAYVPICHDEKEIRIVVVIWKFIYCKRKVGRRYVKQKYIYIRYMYVRA